MYIMHLVFNYFCLFFFFYINFFTKHPILYANNIKTQMCSSRNANIWLKNINIYIL